MSAGTEPRGGGSEASPPPAPQPAAEGRRGPAFAYFGGSDEDKALGLFQILGEDGAADPADVSHLDREHCLRMYRGMLTIRVMDARLMALQRQGMISFYGEAAGQEASVVGTAAATRPEDWLVPALREAGAGLYRGLALSSYIAQLFGNDRDVCRGRAMPCHPCDRNTHYVVMSSCVSTQLPHAVGIAWAMKLCGDRGRACIGYMGDGGTSEPDFHVAMNFAGVFRVPVVLVCENNQWAISTPGATQTAAPTIAIKGLGYGLESLRVDGNDVLACYEAARYALDKARRGDGPTFLELLTYRVSAHTSSDDPSRYRDESVTEVWKRERDPLRRMRAFLERRGWLSSAEEDEISASIETEVRRIATEEGAAPLPALATMFEDVYEQPTWILRQQRDALVRGKEDARENEHGN